MVRYLALLGDPAIAGLGPFFVGQEQLYSVTLILVGPAQAMVTVAACAIKQGLPFGSVLNLCGYVVDACLLIGRNTMEAIG